MAALLYASRADDCPYEVVLVAANDPAAPGLALAAAEGVPVFARSHIGLKRAEFDAIIDAELARAGCDYVALAGYMRLLSAEFVGKWQGRMVNIHPSLLPAHKGLHVHEAVLAAGATVSGCSVHLVTAELDDGPVLGQTRVAVMPGDTPESLAARILIAEHQLYPRVLAALVAEAVSADRLVAQVREHALALPEADEIVSHGMACFGIIKGKKFAYVSIDHHSDGRIALLVKISGLDEQESLIDRDPGRHFRPAYFGDGWIGIRLDLGDTDWDAIGEWLRHSWQAVAPRRLAAMTAFQNQ
jgi:phosphoribosylglycinamide formyltransferase-1